MQNKDLIDKSNCVEELCQISKCEYLETTSKYRPRFEKWEYETILKQMDSDGNYLWITNEDNYDSDESDKIIISSKGVARWQQVPWEANILSEKLLSNGLPQFANKISVNLPLPETKKAFKTVMRKSVLDYYHVSVHQNPLFLEINHHFFPALYNEQEPISKSFQKDHSDFLAISNCEYKAISSLNCDDSDSISSNRGRLFLYETSEQHSPFRMAPLLTSLLVAYSNDPSKIDNSIGIPQPIKRKSPFFGALAETTPYQLSLENQFFRVPVYQHSRKSTDFILIYNGSRLSIRKFEGILLAGKQMPLVMISDPKSNGFRNLMIRVIKQIFIDMEVVPVDTLATLLANIDFLNLEGELQKIAVMSSDKKSWRLRQPPTSTDCLFGPDLEIEDYMECMALMSYLLSYEYNQEDKRLKKSKKSDSQKKKPELNPLAPWSISKSYLNGIRKGFWKLENFEEPTQHNQMDSFSFVTTLVSKRLIEKIDLRKLTMHDAKRLLKKYDIPDNKFSMKRWGLVNCLSTQAATDLSGNVDMEKYARDTKTNRRNIRIKYIQQCNTAFEANRAILSNPKEPESEFECSEDILASESKDISIEDFKKYLKEGLNSGKKDSVLPVIFSSENVKNLIENPLKQFILYRKKDGVVKKEKYVVNEYVLNYLKHAKSGRFGKKLYGIGDLAKKEKQQLRDKLRRQEKYKKKRIEMNLPVDMDSQDTTDKICSSCGRKGHIRTNQECPNFDKNNEAGDTNKSSVQTKHKLTKQDSSVSLGESSSPSLKTINQIPSLKRKAEDTGESQTGKRQKLLLPHLTNQDFGISANCEPPVNDDDDDDFIINIPVNTVHTKPTKLRKPVKRTKSIVPKQRKKLVKKKPKFSACLGPTGEEVIFQSEATLSQPISSSDEDSFKIKIGPEMWNKVQNSEARVVDKSIPVSKTISDSDSDEFKLTFPIEDWNRVGNEKENINQHLESYNWNEFNNNKIADDDDDDDEFTINFSMIPDVNTNKEKRK